MMQTITSLLIYGMISIGMMAIFYGYYHLALRKSQRFQLNRTYLLSSLVLSIITPLIGFFIPATEQILPTAFSTTLPEVIVGGNPTVQIAPASTSLPLPLLIYIGGAAITLGFFCYRLFQIFRFLKGKRREKHGAYTLVHSGGQLETASFFKLLIWNDKAELTESERQQILAHELCHIRQKHSVDLILVEVLRIVFWFNPMIYLFRSALRGTHEFLADRAAIQETGGSGYAHLLLRQVLEGPSMHLAHSFFQSQIKIRMKMLKRTVQPGRTLLRYLPVLPLTLFLALAGCGLSGQSAPPPPPPLPDLTISEPAPPASPESMAAIAEPAPPSDVYVIPPPPPPVPEPSSGTSPEPVPAPVSGSAMPPPPPPKTTRAPKGGIDEMPKPTNLMEVATEMSNTKKRLDIKGEGKAIVRILVDKRGKVAEYEWVKRINTEMDALVDDNVTKMKFSPGVHEGKKVKVWVTLPFKFVDKVSPE